jgi:anti-anti-sigma regulatory factor
MSLVDNGSRTAPHPTPDRMPAAHNGSTLKACRRGETDIVAVAGSVDLPAAVQLRRLLYRRLDAGTRTFLIDLTTATRLDVSTVNVLATVASRLDEKRGSLQVVVADPATLGMLTSAGITTQPNAADANAATVWSRSSPMSAASRRCRVPRSGRPPRTCPSVAATTTNREPEPNVTHTPKPTEG